MDDAFAELGPVRKPSVRPALRTVDVSGSRLTKPSTPSESFSADVAAGGLSSSAAARPWSLSSADGVWRLSKNAFLSRLLSSPWPVVPAKAVGTAKRTASAAASTQAACTVRPDERYIPDLPSVVCRLPETVPISVEPIYSLRYLVAP